MSETFEKTKYERIKLQFQDNIGEYYPEIV